MSDDPPCKAALVKLSRARKHLIEVETLFAEYRDQYEHEDTITTKVLRNGSYLSVEFQMRFLPLSDEFGAAVGDVIHNLRAALDLLASEAAKRQSGDNKGVYFLFAKSAEELEKQIKLKKFTKASPEAVQIVQELKPYIGGNVYLRAIHDLDIQDKHQQLIPQNFSVASPLLRMGDETTPESFIVGDDKKPSEVFLQFPEGSPLSKQKIVSSLHRMMEVTTGIIEMFETLFAQSVDDNVSE